MQFGNVKEFASRYDDWIFNPLFRAYFGQRAYYNTGYWLESVGTQAEACHHLVARLLNAVTSPTHAILDVACGLGATTEDVAAKWPEATIAGINLSAPQLAHCRRLVPGGHFLQMDAAQMAFAEASFDVVLCVEAIFHFDTRLDFLQEAHRILKPGGYLLLSDILSFSERWLGAWGIPPSNNVSDMGGYRELIYKAGFDQIDIEDATAACWYPYCQNFRGWLQEQYEAGQLNEAMWRRWTQVFTELEHRAVQHYVLVTGRKPRAEQF